MDSVGLMGVSFYSYLVAEVFGSKLINCSLSKVFTWSFRNKNLPRLVKSLCRIQQLPADSESPSWRLISFCDVVMLSRDFLLWSLL